MSTALVIFMKAPRPGEVKTRLTTRFTGTEAAECYRAFIRDTLDLAGKVAGVTRHVAFTPDDGQAELQSALGDPDVNWFEQCGDHLGERLSNAFAKSMEKHRDKTVVLGGDSPLLPHAYVEEAVEALDRHDVVLGPALDGGYYLIGLAYGVKTAGHYTRLFESIEWGTARVLEQTRAAIRASGLSCHELPLWYDVDHPADLDRVAREIKSLRAGGDHETGRNTESVLNALGLGRNRS